MQHALRVQPSGVRILAGFTQAARFAVAPKANAVAQKMAAIGQ
jgi:hypothetical protein